jgi:hypothetical protein
VISEHPAGDHSPPVVDLPRRRGRVSGAHLLAAVAAVLAFLANLVVLRGTDQRMAVAVAAADVEAGEPITQVRFVEADVASLDGLVTSREWENGPALVARVSIPAGTPLSEALTVPAAAGGGLRMMSIPVDVAHAAGGKARAGDRVDVVRVVDGVARYVAQDLEVLDAAEAGGGIGLGGYHLVVAVTERQALDLAEAISGGSVEVVITTGAGR